MIKPSFDSQIPEITILIDRRRGSWTLSTVEFDDLKQMILLRAFENWQLFNPEKGPLENWINTLISNAMRNCLRDNLYKFSKPCLGCAFRMDESHCSYTKSGDQCSECPIYKTWKQKKESQYNIKASLPLEHHSQEVNSKIDDYIDIDKSKKIIDDKIKEQLNSRERKVYKLLYVKFMTPSEAAEHIKLTSKSDIIESYSKILAMQKKFVKLAREIVYTEDVI